LKFGKLFVGKYKLKALFEQEGGQQVKSKKEKVKKE
jgi:hypothetical protein